MIDVTRDAIVAKGPPAAPAAKSKAMHVARLWLAGMAGASIFTLCIVAFVLWGFYGPAYIVDLIAAYCG